MLWLRRLNNRPLHGFRRLCNIVRFGKIQRHVGKEWQAALAFIAIAGLTLIHGAVVGKGIAAVVTRFLHATRFQEKTIADVGGKEEQS